MKVLYDNILVTPDEQKESVTESGLYLGSHKKPVQTGVVKYSGEGVFSYGKWIHNEVQVGNHIQFGQDYQKVVIQGEVFYLMKPTNVVCVF